MIRQMAEDEAASSGWRGFYTVAGTAMLFSVLVVVAEILIGFLPGAAHASQRTVTVIDWFTLFQNNWFLGLRNLGLLNLIGAALLTPAFLAMYFALRRENKPWAALGAILFFMGWPSTWPAIGPSRCSPSAASMPAPPPMRRGPCWRRRDKPCWWKG